MNKLRAAIGALMSFNDIEILFGLTNEHVVAAIFGGEIFGEQIEVGLAKNFFALEAKMFAEAVVDENESPFDIFAENEKRERVNEGLV